VGSICYSYQIAIDQSDARMSDTATLSAKFQISIPKAVRTAKHWKAGQRFAFIPKGTGVLLVPVPSARELAGIANGACREDYRDRDDRV
jgi:AbrB family looped-hinge helix DNA binding protein